MIKTLIIGGNRFVGPALIKRLHEKDHEITVFNRGNNYGSTLPKSVKHIIGDRREAINMDVLSTEQYNYIYDLCCYNPRDADNLLDVIQPGAQLIFLSTAAVYAKPRIFPLHEGSALGEWDSFGDYGTNKVLAENKFKSYAKRNKTKLTIFRPVYLLGNNNYFDRENYFFSRIEKELPILMPGKGDALIQFAFLNETANAFAEVPIKQQNQLEILNIAGNEYVSLRNFIAICADIVGKEARIIEVDAAAYGLDEAHFYDELYPFPNLHFIASNKRITSEFDIAFHDLESGLQEIYTNWKSHWSGDVVTYPKEIELIKRIMASS